VIVLAQIATVGSLISGSVDHHNNHILYYNTIDDGDGQSHQEPVYCTGHSITGNQVSGVSKFLVNGQPIAVVGKTGISNCACDGQGFTNSQGSSKFFMGGLAVCRLGDAVDIHSHGIGHITTGIPKFLIP
jgi:uncharacterized Zn-binding protein involved in type VI secretion